MEKSVFMVPEPEDFDYEKAAEIVERGTHSSYDVLEFMNLGTEETKTSINVIWKWLIRYVDVHMMLSSEQVVVYNEWIVKNIAIGEKNAAGYNADKVSLIYERIMLGERDN